MEREVPVLVRQTPTDLIGRPVNTFRTVGWCGTDCTKFRFETLRFDLNAREPQPEHRTYRVSAGEFT